MSLLFPGKAYEVMIDNCSSVYPEEACGILLGLFSDGNRQVISIHPTTNIRHSPTSYLVDPEEQYRIFTLAEERNHEILGFYHSHPYWPATPSANDTESALYPEFIYIIYSVPDKQTKAYVFQNGFFQEENIIITLNGGEFLK